MQVVYKSTVLYKVSPSQFVIIRVANKILGNTTRARGERHGSREEDTPTHQSFDWNTHIHDQTLHETMADLSEDEKVATLSSVTGNEDLAYCRNLLEAHGFDLEAAVNTALGVAPSPNDMGGVAGGGGDGFHAGSHHRGAHPAQQHGGVGVGAGTGVGRGGAPMNPLLALPITVVKSSLGIVFTVIGFGFKVRTIKSMGATEQIVVAVAHSVCCFLRPPSSSSSDARRPCFSSLLPPSLHF